MSPRWLIPACAVALLLACLAGFSAIGGPHNAIDGVSSVLYLTIRAGAPALAYLLAAAGFGRVFARLYRGSPDAAVLQVGLGLGFMLSLSHLLGVLGLLGGRAAMPVAAGSIVLGLALLAHQLLPRRGDIHASLPLGWLLAIPPVALLLVAASQPPGWLWDSEAGGYDALSYHLQLPREWLAQGRLWPNTHSVFSFFPSYVEAAFLHIGALLGGLVSGEGLGVISCQFLSAGIALITVGVISRLCAAMTRRAGFCCSGVLSSVVFLATPWTLVVGSLAYNDLAVVALLAAALLAAMDERATPLRRAALSAFLVGVACGCKPTALLFAAPVAIALLATIPPRGWAKPFLIGAAVGALTLSPWLIRNWLACGNPVFPEAESIFGSAHWSADQLNRYHAATSFHGSFADRLRLMLLPDSSDPAGTRHRGLLHPQWSIFFGITLASAIVALARPATRRTALVLSIGLAAQLLAWLFLTHIQSRFLLPLAIPGCGLISLAVAHTSDDNRRFIPPRVGLAIVACLIQLIASVMIFADQRAGHPNAMLLSGPGVRTGEAFRAELAGLPPAERSKQLDNLGPEAFCNFFLPRDATLYLLGDATPLYFRLPVLYNTTWDTWPLGDAIRAAPADPAAWTGTLLSRGVRFVLLDPGEIDRLTRSGWIDPAITPGAVSDWLSRSARPVKSWPVATLFELLPSPPGASSATPGPDPAR
jgi:hypothetical protein